MNLQPVTMGKYEAQQAFLEYRRGLHAKRSREDEEILRGYRELSRGKKLITLRETFAAAGQHANGLPKLAIVRADQQHVRCTVERRTATFSFLNDSLWRTRMAADKRIAVATPVFVERQLSATAVVPLIPPTMRPDKPEDYHVLWEADWKMPPIDPALLKRVGRDLWAVVAVWDLTPLERAVLLSR